MIRQGGAKTVSQSRWNPWVRWSVVGGHWPVAGVMAEVVQPSAATVPRVHDSTSIRTRTNAYYPCYYSVTKYIILVLASSSTRSPW